ncbi:MAG: SPOR domain-containing protein [Aestuariibacter sp.]
MASAFQNRLVGTIILVALAVIFLPELLDGEKRRTQDRFEAIPARPAMKELTEPESFPEQEVRDAVTRTVEVINEPIVDDPDSNVAIASQTATSQESTSQNEQNTATQIPEIEPKEETVNAGWVVQLGTFRHQKNVRDLLTKLEQAGYRAFSRPVETSAGVLTKVFVGPDLQKSKLEDAVPHLKEVTGLQGRLTQFRVD